MALWPQLKDPARSILLGEKCEELPEDLVARIRASFLTMAGAPTQRPRTARAETPIQSTVLAVWGLNTEDPDSETLARWLDEGAPLGFSQPVETTGVFPVVDGGVWTEEAKRQLERSLDGWENYKSAIEEEADLLQLVQDYQDRGFCHLVDTLAGTRAHLRESGANTACSQGERIILPKLLDIGQAALRVYREGRTPWLAGIDIKDAFMNIPAGADKHMTVSAIPDGRGGHRLVIFDALVFGSASSPTIWGRYAAWLGRTLVCVEPAADVETYVDDPGFVLSG